eukprot:CAMPEP_0119126390 /NCGR_PEP_ID=MMETSP1310-20130426/5334_1 /TAXON_ID=464262 /ORGANISM="Genus nov. species nov., Strain RCC2339" /LENGTH=470 /DNA_ID=CAMNT_0007116549 /DNA_START=138 /DNA_END=1547 /DNA_ORIENTATION=-
MATSLRHNFLTEPELITLSKYKGDDTERRQNVGFGWLIHPVVRLLTKLFIPTHVAPSVLSLAGLLCIWQAFYFCELYLDEKPVFFTVVASILTFLYYMLHRMDRIHGILIRNRSVLSDLFSDACGNVGTVFCTLTLCRIVGIRDPLHSWHIVQILQLALLRYHVKAFKEGYIYFPVLTGPGAAFFWFALITSVRLCFADDWVEVVKAFLHTEDLVTFAYWILLVYSAIEAATLPFSSRNGIIFCLMYRAVPGLLAAFGVSYHEVTMMDVVADGLFMAMVTTDLIVGRKAGRDLHPWIVLFAMASCLNNFLCTFLVVFYFTSLFYEISAHTNLPILSTVINVYCDGIYDMCHLGHKIAFRNALVFGNRLLVGVVADKDATPYKRKPIMNELERAEAVRACKYVHDVIPNAPCTGLTEEFIREHNIHIVAHGEEYDKPEDIYYAVPRKMGITRILPRTQGMSTSVLIARVCK